MTGMHPIEDIPAYALGSLEPEQRRLVENHLAGCSTCRAELAAYQNVMGALPLAAAQHNPLPRLKTALLQQVQPPAPTGRSAWRLRPVWTAAALLAIFLLIVSNLVLWQQVRSLQTGGSDFRMVNLAGTASAPQASGLLVISGGGQFGALIVDGLQPLPAERQYQLWLVQNGQRTSGGVFSVLENGYGVLRVASPKPLNSYSSFGITIEPAGGSPGPTGDKVLGGNL